MQNAESMVRGEGSGQGGGDEQSSCSPSLLVESAHTPTSGLDRCTGTRTRVLE